MFRFRVDGQKLYLSKPTAVVAETIDYLSAKFEFSRDWEGYLKVAHFRSVEKPELVYDIALTDDRIRRADGLNLPEGSWKVYLHGTKDRMSFHGGHGETRITTSSVEIYVEHFDLENGETFPEPEQSVVDLLLRRTKNLTDSGDGKKFLSDDGTYKKLDPSEVTQEYIDEAIEEVAGEKQDKLIAGENVKIENNVISATGGGGGMFAFEVDENGDLYAVYDDGETPPQFEYDEETGNLYCVLSE